MDTAEVRSLDQAIQPTFKLQPVDHKNFRLADGARIGRGRLVHMRIPVRADERRDRDAFATDLLHHVAEDREGGDHRDRAVGLCEDRSRERKGEDGGGCQKRSTGKHGNVLSGLEPAAREGSRGETTYRSEHRRQRIGETRDRDDRLPRRAD